MKGRICLVTGASSGIGKATALGLARLGATVVMVCRNRERGEPVRADVVRQSGNESVELMIADLSVQKHVRDLAAEFRAKHDRLHVLVNNAGIWPKKRIVTADGLELQFAVNHLAHFLLTNLLLDLIKASAPTRIINVTSGIHKGAKIDFDDHQLERGYSGFRAYGQSKLANVLFTYELARRLQGTGVTVNCYTPGMTSTNLGRYMSRVSNFFMRTFAKAPEEGASTAIYLASSPDVESTTGWYFKGSKEKESSRSSYDLSLARRLWEVSERLTGLAP